MIFARPISGPRFGQFGQPFDFTNGLDYSCTDLACSGRKTDAITVFTQLGAALNQLSQRLKVPAATGTAGYLTVPQNGALNDVSAALAAAILNHPTVKAMVPAADLLSAVVYDMGTLASHARQVLNVVNLVLHPPTPTASASVSYVAPTMPAAKTISAKASSPAYVRMPAPPTGIMLPPTRSTPGTIPTPPIPDQPPVDYGPPQDYSDQGPPVTNIPPGVTPEGGFPSLQPGGLPTPPAPNSPFVQSAPPKTHWQKYKWWYIGGGGLGTALSVLGFLWTIRPQKAATK